MSPLALVFEGIYTLNLTLPPSGRDNRHVEDPRICRFLPKLIVASPTHHTLRLVIDLFSSIPPENKHLAAFVVGIICSIIY